MRRSQQLERRLRAIERERREVRRRLEEVRRFVSAAPAVSDDRPAARVPRAEPAPPAPEPAEALPPPMQVGVLEMEAADAPLHESSLEFAPGPDGLDMKRVVMPQLQRTDLLRPSAGGVANGGRLMVPEHDRLQNVYGTTGLGRVRRGRRDRAHQRIRALFMVGMVLVLGFILFKMVT